MGAWGEGPLDSDQGLDWVGENVTHNLAVSTHFLLLKQEKEGGWEMEVRAAAEMVVRIDQLMSDREPWGNLYKRLVGALRAMRADEDWIGAWTEPETVKECIDKQIQDLANLAAQFQMEV